MTELEYKFTYDLLFKMVFTKHVKLLKSLIGLVSIPQLYKKVRPTLTYRRRLLSA